jgi:hypothetical protein
LSCSLESNLILSLHETPPSDYDNLSNREKGDMHMSKKNELVKFLLSAPEEGVDHLIVLLKGYLLAQRAGAFSVKDLLD